MNAGLKLVVVSTGFNAVSPLWPPVSASCVRMVPIFSRSASVVLVRSVPDRHLSVRGVPRRLRKSTNSGQHVGSRREFGTSFAVSASVLVPSGYRKRISACRIPSVSCCSLRLRSLIGAHPGGGTRLVLPTNAAMSCVLSAVTH